MPPPQREGRPGAFEFAHHIDIAYRIMRHRLQRPPQHRNDIARRIITPPLTAPAASTPSTKLAASTAPALAERITSDESNPYGRDASHPYMRSIPMATASTSKTTFLGLSIGLSFGQEPKDYEGPLDAAGMDSDETLEQRKLEYEAATDAFLDEGEADAPKEKLYRKKAQMWVRCTDKQLQEAIGISGWKAFEKPQQGVPAIKWPRAVISPDQGTDGSAALSWMKFSLLLNVICIWDPSHGSWNDVRVVLKLLGLWPMVQLVLIALNLQHGPWLEQRWFQELQQAAEELIAHFDPSMRLFRHFLPLMLEDAGPNSH